MEPNPVSAPQPKGAGATRSASGPTGTTDRSSAIAYSANEDWPKKCDAIS